MSHIEGSQDRDLHDENGDHIGTARTARGHGIEQHEKRIRAHLEAHRVRDTAELHERFMQQDATRHGTAVELLDEDKS